MAHTCKALVFRCMDFRLAPEDLSLLLGKAGYPKNSYDAVSVAGAGKDLLSANAGESEMLLKQIKLSQKLHCISEVVVLYHDNCGAYGIADPVAEEKTQLADLAEVKAKIQERFAGLTVKLFIIKGTASGELKLVAVE